MNKKLLITAVLTSAFLMACSKPNPIHEAMESMGDTYKSLKQAETVADKQQLIAQLEEHVLFAKQQKVKAEDQANYDEGMEKLLGEIQAIKLALSQGNIENIKPQLKALHDIEEEYHELLGVEEH
ncbi:lipoprotein [Catenovulum agarivorans DS-2]|uniref:Lipoprotein n=1 Tax=Catenovulum agarivorans DS-2 TaxID=1328313 RepID=W7QJQ9_9ALTE|nr:cytochrome b562 [Catenovulum agarivorans]EWH12116.1 lipoprotein [Catenovulum agarivorans DS-2]